MMVSVKVCEKVPMNALTVTVPAVDPAVTMTCAWPLALVSTDCDESVAVPLVTAKPIAWFDTGWVLVPFTCTTKGAPKFCPDWVVCRSPDTLAMLAITKFVLSVKLVERPLLLLRAALTVISPDALGARVTVVCAWPAELVMDEIGLTVACPPDKTVQTTVDRKSTRLN